MSILLSLPISGSSEECVADASWLTAKAPLPLFSQPPPARHPAPDCPFYQAAWQVFLYATAPEKGTDGKVVPRFLASPDFTTIEETFGSKYTRAFPITGNKLKGLLSVAPMTLQRANRREVKGEGADVGGGVDQAGSDSCVIDQNGNPIFFAIHFNRVLADFFPANHLLTPEDVKAAEETTKFRTLTFDDGSIELKSAWQVVDDRNPPSEYFCTKAVVPWLTVTADGKLIIDRSHPANEPRHVTLALVAIHVVFTLKGHPEFIWSTFEHLDGQGVPDVAPSAEHNPAAQKPQKLHSPLAAKYTLFPAVGGSPAPGAGEVPISANEVPTPAQISANFDVGKQTFTKTGTVFSTPIYREFWTSKIGEDGIDEDIDAVNTSMAKSVFATAGFDHANDKRDHYRLIGAVWMDDPDGVTKFEKRFVHRRSINNIIDGAEVSSDDPNAVIAGEDRLSGAAMESFTQESTDSPNCFSCHDTSAIRPKTGPPILQPSTANVSHILSRFLLNAPEPVAHP